ncbi:MAG: hypothetical protein ACFFG0_33765 [Candidatus Thorarchaeota archaeon]
MSYSRPGLRAAVFIDHSNITSPILEPICRKNERFDYEKFKEILFWKSKDEGTFMFMGVMDPIKPEKEKFMRYLERIGFVIITPIIANRSVIPSII